MKSLVEYSAIAMKRLIKEGNLRDLGKMFGKPIFQNHYIFNKNPSKWAQI